MKAISTHAHSAKLIRQELKREFPKISFSVRARSFSGGDAIDIEWIDGPTVDSVTKITGKYQYGHFDSMNDIYENSNNIEGLPQVKYVHERREFSQEILEQIFNKMRVTYAGWENLKSIDESSIELFNKWSFWTAGDYIKSRVIRDKDLTDRREFI